MRLGLVGAGLIGARHAAAIAAQEGAGLAWVADPAPAGAEVAARHDVPHYPDLDRALRDRPDGVILATPNRMHAPQGLAVIAARLPLLIEKPLASTPDEARALVAAARDAAVPLLVGHHRRHNPLIARAHALIAEGAIGRVVAIQSSCWLKKPDPYFDTPWRRETGAGPVLVNLIHDLDLMRHLGGEVAGLSAQCSNAIRGFEVEDTAAVLLRFASGALGTMSLSDTIPAPWSWELTARENPAYPATGQSCYLIGGTAGALSLPDLRLWRHEGGGGWWDPITTTSPPVPATDPLIAQIANFTATIAGTAHPVVTGTDGLRALELVTAIHTAAHTGGWVEV